MEIEGLQAVALFHTKSGPHLRAGASPDLRAEKACGRTFLGGTGREEH